MEYIELLGVNSPSFKSKLTLFFSSIPNDYSIVELKQLVEEVINGKKIRFEFNLPLDKARDFASDLIEQGFLIGDSSIHEDKN